MSSSALRPPLELLQKELAERSLAQFIRLGWRNIDPNDFSTNWHIDAVSEHLEAITRGELRRLVINIPPRHMKSIGAAVAWPAWTWAQGTRGDLSGPQVRFLFASYAQTLSVRDSVKCRRLMESPWFQANWGDRFGLSSDQNTKVRFDNDKFGYRLATSVDGALTGEGGDCICFPADEVVATENGYRKIGNLVRERARVRVWSYDVKTGRTELKPVTGWHANPRSAIVRVRLSDGSAFRCTPDHKIWTRRGWVAAIALRSDDVLPGKALSYCPDGAGTDSVDRGEFSLTERTAADIAHGGIVEHGKRVLDTPFAIGSLAAAICNGIPSFAAAELLNGSGGNTELGAKDIGGEFAPDDLQCLLPVELRPGTVLKDRKGAVVLGVVDVFGAGSVAEIVERGVAGVPVPVAHLLPTLGFAQEGQSHSLVHKEIDGDAVSAKADSGIPLVGRRFEDLTRDGDLSDDAGKATYPPQVGHHVAGETGNRSPVLVEFVGHEQTTFCLTVADNNTFMVSGGNVIVSNCVDDPHNANEIHSEAMRFATLDWWDGSMSSRLNNPKTGAYVVIMQRLHENDLTGHILETNEGEWTHLCLPARYEGDHPFHYAKDPRKIEGELLWPSRVGETEVRSLERTMGAYGAAGQLQQRPAPRDGGLFKPDDFEKVTHVPAKAQRVRRWDLAASAVGRGQKDPDWTVGLLMALDETGTFYIEDIVRMRGTSAEVEAQVIETAQQDADDYGIGEVEQALSQDPGQAGKAQVAYLTKQLAGHYITSVNETGKKLARAQPLSSQVEAGNVKIVRSKKWNQAFLDEVAIFPNGKHDDQVDAAAGAFHALVGPEIKGGGFLEMARQINRGIVQPTPGEIREVEYARGSMEWAAQQRAAEQAATNPE